MNRESVSSRLRLQEEMGFREQIGDRRREDTSSTEIGMRHNRNVQRYRQNGSKLKEFLPDGLCFLREVESAANC